ncbi:MAG: HD domain-containing protein [Clostridia bacterium]|nr:HD domain-containing protein [Clostridia bacterium]
MDLIRLEKQIQFIIEIDKLKQIYRQTLLTDGSRNENDAEHSWHLAIMAAILWEHAESKDIDLSRVIKMVLIHDLVEIDAGDTFCYDEKGNRDKREREEKAAQRIFNILDSDQADELRSLWEEFEGRQTPEAKFASSLDRLQPLLHNYMTKGAAWKKHGITRSKVIERNKHIAEGSPILWNFALDIIQKSVENGYLPEN